MAGEGNSQSPLVLPSSRTVARSNTRALETSALSVWQQLGAIVEHIFAATSHFRGPHNSIGGSVTNQLRKAEPCGTRIPDCAAVVAYQQQCFNKRSDNLDGYFRQWSTRKIRKVHMVKLKAEIIRPSISINTFLGTMRKFRSIGGVNGMRSVRTGAAGEGYGPDSTERVLWVSPGRFLPAPAETNAPKGSGRGRGRGKMFRSRGRGGEGGGTADDGAFHVEEEDGQGVGCGRKPEPVFRQRAVTFDYRVRSCFCSAFEVQNYR